MSFCDQCGSSLGEGDKFCTTCGAAVAPSTTSAKSTETDNAGTYSKQSATTWLDFAPTPEMTGGTSSSSESELPTVPTKKRSHTVPVLSVALAVLLLGGIAYGIVNATSDNPVKATSSLATGSSESATTTTAPTTTTPLTKTTEPSGNGTSLHPGFSSSVPPSLRASILKSQPNLAALDTFVSIVDDPSYPSWVEVCAQDAGPTSPGAANGYANDVDEQWSFTGFGTAWAPPFPLDLTQTIVNTFAACP